MALLSKKNRLGYSLAVVVIQSHIDIAPDTLAIQIAAAAADDDTDDDIVVVAPK